MNRAASLLICSDPHYACAAEQARGNYELDAIDSAAQRLIVRIFRHLVWLRNPLAHNHLAEAVLNPGFEPDVVVANGDYSCDSAFIGLSDGPAFQSAIEILGKFRQRYGARFFATIGDHELGKRTLAGGRGGLRLASWEAATQGAGLKPLWTQEVGEWLLLGVTSTLIALPVYEGEALPEEREHWRGLRAIHFEELHKALERVGPNQRLILFCHDPTALSFLHDDAVMHSKLNQLERTIIGHLHTPELLWQSRLLAGMPRLTFLGNAVRRMSSALNQAKKWKPFRILLCPSFAGVQMTKRGGYYTTTLPECAQAPLEFEFHPISWDSQPAAR